LKAPQILQLGFLKSLYYKALVKTRHAAPFVLY
jgi:hypothetical protein